MVSKTWIQKGSCSSEIERIKLVEKTVSFHIRHKKVDDNTTLVSLAKSS